WRKKSPYPKTHNPSYEQAVRKLLNEVINERTSPVLQLLKKDKLEELVNGREKVQWYGQLMNNPQIMAYILQVNYWMKKFNVEIV
ncbi:MAG: asparagine synthase-related protein, partial [Oscillospiraceae bacterium]